MKNSVFKETTLSDRERKNLQILDVISKNGSVSRTEITRVTGLNIVTVSHYVDHYIKQGLVYEKGYDVSSGGRKPTLVELNPKKFLVIGVEVGPQIIRGVVTDLVANPVIKIEKQRPQGLMEEVIMTAIEVIRELIQSPEVDKEKLKGIGMGISGIIDVTSGIIRDTDDLRGSTSTSYSAIKSKIEREFGLPVYLGNDATVATYGEKWLSLEHDVENVIYVYSDVGCGIIIKGEIYTGSGGSAGEVQINLDLPELKEVDITPPTLLRGMGGTDSGITQMGKNIVLSKRSSKIYDMVNGDVSKVNMDIVIKAAKEGDDEANRIVNLAALNMGIRIAYLINLFNPEIVVVGGGVEKAGEFFMSKVKRVIKGAAYEEPYSMVKILASRLGENAVCLGSSLLVVKEVFIAM